MKKTGLFHSKAYFRLAGMVTGVLLFMACTDESFMDNVNPGDGSLCFDVYESSDTAVLSRSGEVFGGVFKLQGETPADTLFLHATETDWTDVVTDCGREVQTRASETTESTITSFGLFATAYPGNANAWNAGNNDFTPDYIYDVQVYKDNNWTLNNYFWPVGKMLRLCAYSPYKAQNVTISEKSKTGNPELTYRAPRILENQCDLVVAVSETKCTESTSSVAMNFKHVLTRIQVKAASTMPAGKITRVAIRNIYNKNTLIMGLNNITWKNEHTIDGNWNYCEYDTEVRVGGKDVDVMTGNNALMLLPQTLPSGAVLEITYTPDATGKQQIFTADIASEQWLPGRSLTYTIRLSSTVTPTFTVDGFGSKTFAYDGGSTTFSLASYTTTTIGGSSTVTPLSWSVSYSTNNGSSWTNGLPPYVELIPPSGFNVGDGTNGNKQTYNLRFMANKLTFNQGTVSRKLQDAPAQSSLTNLANGTTANCYLINCAGDYCFPLVYGNGLLNGAVNESAYKYKGSYYNGTDVMKVMYNHKGNEITSPRIWENTGCTPKDAIVVWSDAPDVISNVRIADERGTKMMYFSITKDAIRQCNAILAVRDQSGNIMWSWHIWVTDITLGSTLSVIAQNNKNLSYDILEKPIGLCEAESASCNARAVKLKFTQASTNQSVTIDLNQRAGRLDVPFRACYFEWGRKDPMRPAIGNGSDMTLYYVDNKYQYTFKPDVTATVSEAILNPHIMYGGKKKSDYDLAYNWTNTSRVNLWDNYNAPSTSAIEAYPTKTIYDPSPKGFCVPPGKTFSGILTGTYTAGGVAILNSPYQGLNGSFYFEIYRDIDKLSWMGTYKIPAVGYRAPNTGNTAEFHEGVVLWTCQSSDAYKSGIVWPSTGMIYTYISSSKAAAGIVMPCRQNN